MGVDGEARQIVESYQAGLCFEPESEDDFNRKLHLLLSDSALYEKCKEGCRKLAHDFNRKLLAEQMLHVIKETK